MPLAYWAVLLAEHVADVAVGNEYWSGIIDDSDDPAAVCCSTIVELHNPYVNPFEHRIKVLQERDRS